MYKRQSLSSADIHSKFSGEADKIVERAFKEAVDNAPCILFMDEVDGITFTITGEGDVYKRQVCMPQLVKNCMRSS